MKYLRFLSFLSFLALLCQCSTTPKEPKIILPKSQSSYSTKGSGSDRYNDIDLNHLYMEMNMDHPVEDLGFQERSFDTCEVEANKSKKPFCQTLYVARLNFQVMCRDSTGTVERVNLTPLARKRLRWKGGLKRGSTSTNSKGFGSLGFISRRPASHGHLYLYLGSKIARKRFQDNWKLILPKNWCSRR